MATLNVTISRDYSTTVLTNITAIVFLNRGATASFSSTQFDTGPIAANATITSSALNNHIIVTGTYIFARLLTFANWDAADRVSLLGGTGNDVVDDSVVADLIEGREGNDWLRSEHGADTVNGGIGNDTVHGREGVFDGGAGSDLLRLRLGGALLPAILDMTGGGGGRRVADYATISSFERIDLGGTAFDDQLRLGTQDDVAFGDMGNDLLHGRTGNDTLAGHSGNDTVNGGVGDDKVTGGEGNDSLYGEDGGDLLIGGTGRDVMAGGAGADLFIFDAPAESVAGTYRDVITDFQQGLDMIDLSLMDNGAISGDQDFRFVGQTTFRGGRMEVRFSQTATDTLIQGSIVKGDADQQFEIKLVGLFTLTVNDFIL